MHTLPDVTSDIQAEKPSTLQWVGMEQIAVPINLPFTDGNVQNISAKVNVFVSLDSPKSKGIHMSRLHLVVNRLADIKCTKENIETLLADIISSQDGISYEAKIELHFDMTLTKPALLSDESGFQSYPVVIRAEKNQQKFDCELELTIPYSSTCPCSASLTQQVYADTIDELFSGETIDKKDLLSWVTSKAGSVATPHSQRSFAYLRFSIGNAEWPDLLKLVFNLEQVIGTPVQTAVKRSDEQEFARLNATNLMFCEDAARRLKQGLEQISYIQNYWFKIEHQESLHAHNAVVIDQKFKSETS